MKGERVLRRRWLVLLFSALFVALMQAPILWTSGRGRGRGHGRGEGGGGSASAPTTVDPHLLFAALARAVVSAGVAIVEGGVQGGGVAAGIRRGRNEDGTADVRTAADAASSSRFFAPLRASLPGLALVDEEAVAAAVASLTKGGGKEMEEAETAAAAAAAAAGEDLGKEEEVAEEEEVVDVLERLGLHITRPDDDDGGGGGWGWGWGWGWDAGGEGVGGLVVGWFSQWGLWARQQQRQRRAVGGGRDSAREGGGESGPGSRRAFLPLSELAVYVDPLDGSADYAAALSEGAGAGAGVEGEGEGKGGAKKPGGGGEGRGAVTVSACITRCGRPVAALLYLPFEKRLYWTRPGSGRGGGGGGGVRVHFGGEEAAQAAEESERSAGPWEEEEEERGGDAGGWGGGGAQCCPEARRPHPLDGARFRAAALAKEAEAQDAAATRAQQLAAASGAVADALPPIARRWPGLWAALTSPTSSSSSSGAGGGGGAAAAGAAGEGEGLRVLVSRRHGAGGNRDRVSAAVRRLVGTVEADVRAQEEASAAAESEEEDEEEESGGGRQVGKREGAAGGGGGPRALPRPRATLIPMGGAGYKASRLLEGKGDVYAHAGALRKWDTCAAEALVRAMGGRGGGGGGVWSQWGKLGGADVGGGVAGEGSGSGAPVDYCIRPLAPRGDAGTSSGGLAAGGKGTMGEASSSARLHPLLAAFTVDGVLAAADPDVHEGLLLASVAEARGDEDEDGEGEGGGEAEALGQGGGGGGKGAGRLRRKGHSA